MSVTKDMFLVDLGPDVIDLAEIDENEWNFIKAIVQDLIKRKLVTDVSKAYIAAFLQWLDIQRLMLEEFNSVDHKMN